MRAGDAGDGEGAKRGAGKLARYGWILMILNIVDRRTRVYRWRNINAIVESTWHDNQVADSDLVDEAGGVDYAERENVSLQEAIRWADAMESGVTLFLYDRGRGTSATEDGRAKLRAIRGQGKT